MANSRDRISGNQRARAYKERLKQPGNEEKLAAFKERNKEYYRRYREKQLLTNPEEYKRKRSESAKKCRAKKAGQLIEMPKSIKTKRLTSFEEDVDRVMKSLPKNKLQAIEVIQILLKKYL